MAALSLRNQATLTANALRNLAGLVQQIMHVPNVNVWAEQLRDHADDLDRAVKSEERVYDK